MSGEIELRSLNFLGGARSAGVHATWSWLDRGVEGSFTQSYLFGRPLSLNLQGHGWFEDEASYRVLSRGGRASIAYAPAPQTLVTATYLQEFESSRISNEALQDLSQRDQLIALGVAAHVKARESGPMRMRASGA